MCKSLILGSRVYGTANAQSDWDFMVIVTELTMIQEDHFLWECYDDGLINCALYSAHYFQLMVWEHRMEAIECLFLAPKYVNQLSFLMSSSQIFFKTKDMAQSNQFTTRTRPKRFEIFSLLDFPTKMEYGKTKIRKRTVQSPKVPLPRNSLSHLRSANYQKRKNHRLFRRELYSKANYR